MRLLMFLATAIAVLAGLHLPNTEVVLRCTADMNVSSYEGETDLNYGASTRIRLKGIQMLGVLRFDCAPLVGQEIVSATLRLRYAGGDRRLRTIGLSTISSDWDEGSGAGERKAGSACFAEASLGRLRWDGPESDFTDVTFTRGNTLAAYSDCRNTGDGWIEVDVPARLVEAMVTGASYGLVVSDEKGQTMANNDVFSREQSGSSPSLVVQARPARQASPSPLADLSCTSAPEASGFGSAGLRIEFAMPRQALTVVGDVQEAGRAWAPIARARLPFATNQKRHAILLDGLLPQHEVRIRLRAVGPTGLLGPMATLSARTGPAKSRPAPLPRATDGPGPALVSSGGATLAAGLVGGAYDPWRDALKGVRQAPTTLRMRAVRGETMGVALSLAAASDKPTDVTLGLDGSLPVRLFLVRSVPEGGRVPEVCVPTKLDATRRARLTGVNLPVCLLAEPFVPSDSATGSHRAQLSASVGQGAPLRLELVFDVLPLQLPARPSFDLSLNTYGSPARAAGLEPTSPQGRDAELAFHRIAHEHRATLTPLGYSHSGQVEPGYAPTTVGSGASRAASDWKEWDKHFGPLLDGSAFVGTPRGAVPVTHLYLPFHEAWPEDIRAAYAYSSDEARYPAMIVEHAMRAGPTETLLPATYAQGIEAMVRAFLDHIHERRWTRTTFHFYMNNKHYYKDPAHGGRGTSWWLLDEPNHRDDWLALAWYAARLRHASAGHPAAGRVVFREDISRPQWQRDYLDGLVDLMVVGGELRSRPRLMHSMRREQRCVVWLYGSAPVPGEPAAGSVKLPVEAYLLGADGYVPWQSVGPDSAYDRPEETALILPGRRLGLSGPVASIRLKAMGYGQQLVEEAKMLASQRRWDREQLREAVATYVSSNDFVAMRAAVLRALSESYAPAGRRSQRAILTGHSAASLPRLPRPNP